MANGESSYGDVYNPSDEYMTGPTDRPLWKQSREYNPDNERLKSFGKPYKNLPYNHRLLDLDHVTPQQYNSLIQNWEQLIIQEWAKLANKEETEMIEPTVIDKEILAGEEWKLSELFQTHKNSPLVPQSSYMYKDSKGRLSVRFGEYEERPVLDIENEENDITQTS